MAEKIYEVIAEKLTGKHRVYKKGDKIPESELMIDVELALKGQKDKKNKRNQLLPNVAPVIKPVTKKATK